MLDGGLVVVAMSRESLVNLAIKLNPFHVKHPVIDLFDSASIFRSPTY